MALRGPRFRRVGVIALVAAAALTIAVSSAGGSRVKASDFKFRPGTITVQRGQTVTWKQVSGAAHRHL